jgi:hypothetical protein
MVTLSAELTQLEGTGGAIIWLRADGEPGALAFVNSQRDPVAKGASSGHRSVQLYIPNGTRRLAFGISVAGKGTAKAEHLKLVDVRRIAPMMGVQPLQLLDSALDIVQSNALKSHAVPWEAMRPELRSAATKSVVPADVYPYIRSALFRLGDGHSFFREPDAVEAAQKPATEGAKVSVLARDGVGYITVPAYTTKDVKSQKKFVGNALRDIRNASTGVDLGWVVDLRSNEGGNMWPMLRALEHLLGTKVIGSFVYPNGEVENWQLPKSAGSSKFTLEAAPVAVLIGKHTASAGEAVAIAFKGRPNTRFFGAATFGQTSGNKEYPLPDGSEIVLAVAKERDRDGNIYDGPVTPDVDAHSDEMETAEKWLRLQLN